jgi:hypothetical protein
LEHFKKLQGKLEFHQNKGHPGNAPDMRRQCAKATDPWAYGVADRRNSLAGQPHFAAYCGLASEARSPGGDNKESEARNQTRWPQSHVASPTGQHLVCYQLNQVDNSSLDPYKYPPVGGIQDTTFWRFHLQSSHS